MKDETEYKEKRKKPDLSVYTEKHEMQGYGYFFCYRCDLPHIYSGKSPSCEYFKFYDDVKKSKNIDDFKL